MTEFTIEDVRRIMREAAGEDEATPLDGDIAHQPFGDLGYDSLAVLELAARVQQEYGVPMPDDAVAHLTTPAAVTEYVGQRLAPAPGGR
ncbi:acyl carrier protein [Plantactinospora siamensis]|uniref:Acyl carrier protein n=1 Tax=Plantactinospora siamensis TaxID=555372 RepID=A0ABV6NWQ7_9ACTN